MNLLTKDPSRTSAVVLTIPVGSDVRRVEISNVNGSLLIRIEECDVLDLLPLSTGAATRVLYWLGVPGMQQEAWMSFLTQPASMDQALGLIEKEFGVKASS